MTGAELKALRVSLGVTRADLAAALGVNPVTVWRWETGKTNSSRAAEVGVGPGRGVGVVGGAVGVPSAAVEWLHAEADRRIAALERWKLYRETDSGPGFP